MEMEDEKAGKNRAPRGVQRNTHAEVRGTELFFKACMGGQLESQTLWNDPMKSTKLAFYVTL